MNATHLSLVSPVRPVPALVVPRELDAILAESETAQASFERLGERDRRRIVSYVSDSHIPQIRERRAALVAMSLRGLGMPRF